MRKSLFLRLWLVLLLAFSLFYFSACKESPPKQLKKKPRKASKDKRIKKLKEIPLVQLRQPTFAASHALEYIKYLSVTIGSRRQGTSQEKEAASYIAGEFEKMGYATQVQSFSLPDGSTSQNVIATKEGKNPTKHLVVGAHYDTKTTVCPGADDNASGVGVLLELAHLLKDYPTYPTIDFVAFGAEELFDANKNNHHFGSRHYVAILTPVSKSQIFGMISIDMVGAGPNFHVRSLGLSSKVIANNLILKSNEAGRAASYLSDPGWSDHEAFERASIPSAWLEWRPSPNYHSPRDVYETIKSENIEITGKTVLNFILSLDENKLVEMFKQR